MKNKFNQKCPVCGRKLVYKTFFIGVGDEVEYDHEYICEHCTKINELKNNQ